MVEQCSLLQGDSLEVTSAPFQLLAASCEWRKLSVAVKKKDHPWRELPGGALDAPGRVKKRPETFINVLNPNGGNDWTFEHTVCESPDAYLQLDEAERL